MKKIINNPNDVVKEMLQGMAKSDPSIRYIADSDIIVRSQKADKVGILTGGGSGHEPAHAGYVGPGMLTAAVAGDVLLFPGDQNGARISRRGLERRRTAGDCGDSHERVIGRTAPS